MSGHKQPTVVKQTREVASLVYPVFLVVVIHWLPCVLTGPFYTVGDPTGSKIRWLKGQKFCLWKLENRLQTASIFLPLSHSLVEAQTEVTQGTAHALRATTPTLTSQLTQTQRATGAQRGADRHMTHSPNLKARNPGLCSPAVIYRLLLTRLQPAWCTFSLLARRHTRLDLWWCLSTESDLCLLWPSLCLVGE